MAEKCVLYLAGGGMSGVFGAGVLTSLSKLGFYKKIDAIYAGSCGAFNAAYFLTRQTEIGSSIYFEDMKKNFIFPSHMALGILQRLWSGWINKIPEKRMLNAIDIDYLMNIVRNVKKPNISSLKRQKIPFFISLYDFRNDKIEYFNIKYADPYLILRAAICIVPYTFCRQELNGIDFIDGTIKEPINLDYFLKKYPNRKIIIVFNGRRASGIRHNLKGWAEGVVASSMLKNKLYSSYISRESKARKDIKNALSNSRVLLVYPDKKSPVRPRSRDYSTLMATFNQGLSKGKEIAKYV